METRAGGRSGWLVLGLLTILSLPPAEAWGAGLAARFRPLIAREASPLVIEVEVDDPMGASASAVVEIKSKDRGEWASFTAEPTDVSGVYRCTAQLSPPPVAGELVLIRARVLGARGGILLELGQDEALEVEILSDARYLEAEKLLTRKVESEGKLDLIAYVGVEGRLGSGARARGVVSIGARLSAKQELVLGVAVGPAFERPSSLSAGGPIVLGVEAAYRAYTVVPLLSGFAPFVDVVLSSDFRLPGFDPELGARLSISIDLSLDTRLDLALGGAAQIFNAAGGGETTLGFSGGLRTTLRFGSFGEGKAK